MGSTSVDSLSSGTQLQTGCCDGKKAITFEITQRRLEQRRVRPDRQIRQAKRPKQRVLFARSSNPLLSENPAREGSS